MDLESRTLSPTVVPDCVREWVKKDRAESEVLPRRDLAHKGTHRCPFLTSEVERDALQILCFTLDCAPFMD